MTRICVPTAGRGGLDDNVGEHFGRVPTYTIYNTETDEANTVDNTSEHMGGQGLPGEILGNLGIDVLLCAGLGRRALSLLAEKGIDVCTGVTGTVRDAIDEWKKGNLSPAGEADACQQHKFHDHQLS